MTSASTISFVLKKQYGWNIKWILFSNRIRPANVDGLHIIVFVWDASGADYLIKLFIDNIAWWMYF